MPDSRYSPATSAPCAINLSRVIGRPERSKRGSNGTKSPRSPPSIGRNPEVTPPAPHYQARSVRRCAPGRIHRERKLSVVRRAGRSCVGSTQHDRRSVGWRIRRFDRGRARGLLTIERRTTSHLRSDDPPSWVQILPTSPNGSLHSRSSPPYFSANSPRTRRTICGKTRRHRRRLAGRCAGPPARSRFCVGVRQAPGARPD